MKVVWCTGQSLKLVSDHDYVNISVNQFVNICTNQTHSCHTKWNTEQSNNEVATRHRKNVVIRFTFQLLVSTYDKDYDRVTNHTAAKQAKVKEQKNSIDNQKKRRVIVRHS